MRVTKSLSRKRWRGGGCRRRGGGGLGGSIMHLGRGWGGGRRGVGITEYENALASSPRKHADGPLFEVIKGSTKPGDKSSPIAKLPNGAYISLQTTMNTNPSQGPILTLRRGLDTRYCPPFAERSRRCVPCLSPLPWCSYYPTRVAGGFRSLLPWPTLPRRRGIPLSAGRQW